MKDVALYKLILNSMTTHIAILDEKGVILETNRAWDSFGEKNGLESKSSCIDCNYINISESGATDPDEDGVKVANGIRQVISGEIEEFFMHYPCHSPDEKRWYSIKAVAFQHGEALRVIVSHDNITPIVKIQKELEKNEEILKNQTEKLEETNIALRVLLDQRNEDKKQIEATVFANVDRLVLPYLEKLRLGKLSENQRMLVDLANSNLQEIVSPFLQRLASLEARLTPQEVEIAHLIRSGHSTKEIAGILFLSSAGVDFHRKNLRKKFGLTHTKQNLRTFLMSLQ